ncbi:sensor histidine kinase [Ammoniphilus sp. YIM 78166]|uniref:ATP-binding protein n=1 Tax=Ammoniphilus sp. YIM 78166 TaxID=1644106 RepID=UPI00106F8143|nr:sensor histidine kinase [Ammoniphilus sp. YIM 78166]
MRLQTKLILLISSLVILVIAVTGISSGYLMNQSLKQQMGARALDVATTISRMPSIREAFLTPEPWNVIQPVATDIQKNIEAEFVVIGNHEGIRYSHPNPEQIGKEMVGGDNRLVLAGQPTVTEAIGSLGPSLRGKAPIFNDAGEVIGLVSVGFLMKDIERAETQYRRNVLFFGLLALLVGGLGALLISRNVKQSILGLEPREITQLYQEKQAIIQSIREGIVATDARGKVSTVNSNALKFIGTDDERKVIGKPIGEVFSGSPLALHLSEGKAEYDQEIIIGDQVVIANRLPIINQQQEVVGVVSSFRSKSELYSLAKELAQVKQYAEALRAQTHEHSNKLYMIYGLIQLESYQEAIEVITKEVGVHQNLVRFIMKEIPDPIVGGLLIGNFNRAQELQVELEIDEESSFSDIPPEIDRMDLATILGNLIGNAMEEVSAQEVKKVKVFLTDLGTDLIMEVEDSGKGIPDEDLDKIFQLGYSTKSTKNRGVGLALVQQAVNKWNGFISYARNSEGGSIFTVLIPKNGRGGQHEHTGTDY